MVEADRYLDVALATDFLSKYKVRDFFKNTSYKKDITLPGSQNLTLDTINNLRAQLKRKEAEYMFDGFLMDLVLSPKSSKEEKSGLIQLMQKEDEIACGLKALERRYAFTTEEICELIPKTCLSLKTILFYQLPYVSNK